jgi:glycosyl transferase family 25
VFEKTLFFDFEMEQGHMSAAQPPVPVVYINLDDALQRRQRLVMQFEKMGIQAERLEAVRWSHLGPQEQARLYSGVLNKKQYHTELVGGEKGCYASHIQAWKMLLDSEHDVMVVLEDDVQLSEHFRSVITALVNLDMAWDMVKLIGRTKEKVQAKRGLCEGFELIDYARVPSYTAGYVLSREGAQKMLQSRVPFGRPIDVDLRFWWENDMRILGVWPAVLTLDETSDISTIAGRKTHRNVWMKWRKLKMKMGLTWGNVLHGLAQKNKLTAP